MNGKATVTAPSNIAFIKYWGARDLAQAVPVNASISMTLTECVSLSTVAFLDGSDEPDRIELAGDDGSLTPPPASFRERALAHRDEDRQAKRADLREGLRCRRRHAQLGIRLLPGLWRRRHVVEAVVLARVGKRRLGPRKLEDRQGFGKAFGCEANGDRAIGPFDHRPLDHAGLH